MTIDAFPIASDMLLQSFDVIAASPGGIARLRQLILQLAVQGRLVEQDPNDEPASVLLERIRVARGGEKETRRGGDRTQRSTDGKQRHAERSEASRGVLWQNEELFRSDQHASDDQSTIPFTVPKKWVWTRLTSILRHLQTGPFGSNLHKEDYELGGIPVVNPASIRDGKIMPLASMAVGQKTLERLSEYKLYEGDIVFGRRGEMGRCAVVTSQEVGWLCGTGSLILRFEQAVTQDYAIKFFSSEYARSQLLADSVGSTMNNLNQRILLNLQFPLPPLAEQRRIVARVDALMALCDALEAKLRVERAAAEQLAATLCRAIATEQPITADGATEDIDTDLILELPARRRHLVEIPPVEAEAILLAYALQQHHGTRGESTFGHVKAEKIAHMVEAITRRDLGRQPQRMPRGPSDARQLERAIALGRDCGAFSVVAREHADWGYRFAPEPNLAPVAARLPEAFGEHTDVVARIVSLLVPLKTRQAEAVATLYAVWNDMLQAGLEPGDERIFGEFRAFHPQKEHFLPETLMRWLAWMREHTLVPDGTAKPTLPATRGAAPSAARYSAAAVKQPQNAALQIAEEAAAYRADNDYDQAVALLIERGMLTNNDLQVALNIDAAEARTLLKRLVAEGLARQEGQRRGARYVRAKVED